MPSIEFHAKGLRDAKDSQEAFEHRHFLLRKKRASAARALVKYGLNNKDEDIRRVTEGVLRQEVKFSKQVPKSMKDVYRQGLLKFYAKKLRLSDNSDEGKSWITKIAELNTSEAARAIMKYGCGHKHNEIQSRSAYALDDIQGKRINGILINEGLTHKNKIVVVASILRLGNERNKRAIKPLLKILRKTKDKQLTILSSKALCQMGDKRVTKDVLEYGLNRPFKRTEKLVPKLYEKMPENKRKEIGRKYLDYSYIVTETAEALGELGDTKALPHLMKMTGLSNSISDSAKKAIQKIQEAERAKH